MNKKQKNIAWEHFTQTGTVEAYLDYKREPKASAIAAAGTSRKTEVRSKG